MWKLLARAALWASFSGALVLGLASNARAGEELILLDFTSEYCGPCRSMAPVIDRLVKDGYAVRQIDIHQEAELANRFGVRNVPCFVLVDGGREVSRTTGATSYARLTRMFEEHQAVATAENVPSPKVTARGQSPDPQGAPSETDEAAPANPFSNRTRSPLPTLSPPAGGRDAKSHLENIDPALVQAALAASVLITVEERNGRSHGTGTIVDVQGGEALVLTCGHLFRDLPKDAKITIQLGAAPSARAIPAHVLDFDAADRDIGLMHARLGGIEVAQVQVAASGKAAKVGGAAFSIGCNFGEAASVVPGRITAENRYLGAPTISAEGLPVVGRSGGGLFNADGELIGVCNYADKEYQEGLYASLATIHWQLDRSGLREVYARAASHGPNGLEVAAEDGPAMLDRAATGNDPAMAKQMPASPGGVAAIAQELGVESDAEVICIVRSKRRPAEPNVIVMDRASPELLELIDDARRRQATSRQSPSDDNISGGRSREPIYRGQSHD